MKKITMVCQLVLKDTEFVIFRFRPSIQGRSAPIELQENGTKINATDIFTQYTISTLVCHVRLHCISGWPDQITGIE